MRATRTIPAIIIASSLLSGNALAVGVSGDLVYEKVDMFSNSIHFTDSFMIGTQGTYKATLTDFEFPNPFASSGLNITTSTDSLGKLLGPGSVMFDAGPGDYYISMFATVAPISAEAKQELVNAEKKRRSDEYWQSLTEEQKQEKLALRKNRSEEEKKAIREKAWERAERLVDEQLANIDNLGQYGIQIALVESGSGYPGGGGNSGVVPLPGAVWLFGTGLLGLVGFSRRSSAQRS